MGWKIEDTRVKLDFSQAKAGDLIIDEDDDMFFIICDYDGCFALLNISSGEFNMSMAYDSVEELLDTWTDDFDIKDIIPAEKISIKI